MDDGGAWSVQFWLRLGEKKPLPFQQRILVARPGAWALVIRRGERWWRRPEEDGEAALAPPLITELAQVVYSKSGHVGSVGWFELRHGEWIRISVDLSTGVGGGGRGQRVDDIWATALQGGTLAGSREPLYVGGVPPDAWQDATPGRALPYSPIAATTIELDDLHFAADWRGVADVQWHAQPDDETAGLWHFEEGEGADHYTSAAPQEFRLYRATLDVSSARKVATTWAHLRAGNRGRGASR